MELPQHSPEAIEKIQEKSHIRTGHPNAAEKRYSFSQVDRLLG
jgi:hypothetical protein